MKRERDCLIMRNNLPDYLRGALSTTQRGEVENHLSKCTRCQEEAGVLKTALDVLAVSVPDTPSEVYWRNFLPRLRERLEVRKKILSAPWIEKFLIPAAGLLVAVLILSRITVVPVREELSSDLREIVAEMNADELRSATRIPPSLSDGGLKVITEPLGHGEIMVAENGGLTGEELGRHVVRSLLDVSGEEVHHFSEASLLGSSENGLESLTDEEVERVITSRLWRDESGTK